MSVHAFPKSIIPKVNMIVRLEFKLAYHDVTVHHISRYTIERGGLPPDRE